MSYDVPAHVMQGLKLMGEIADREVMLVCARERTLKDQGDATWGFIAHQLYPLIKRTQGEMRIALTKGDVMPVVAALQEKIEVWDHSGDAVQDIFATAAKSMLHHIDPSQYPEIQATIDALSSISRRKR